ncbi:hypothetical protein C5E04_18785 [Pectobacterium parmentieri]|uniref:hypothetical protein n=1 Tax=Pectobacterium parmentieri TaxID=1905730 RepID=UPI000EAC0E09|nr:hypothetical protein [Pectobacterium parmentieri]RKO74367.1 hypothetical protein C5E04_18785 [Pectobacterium parmentieri]
MSLSDKKEQKEAYLDALRIAPLDRGVLKRIHAVNDNTLDKWLYVADRYPTFRACWELWMFQRKRRVLISRKLHVLINRSTNRTIEAFEKTYPPEERVVGKSYRDLVTEKGERSANMYIINGEVVGAKDASILLGYSSYNTLYAKMKRLGIQPGDDISHLKPEKRGRKKECS